MSHKYAVDPTPAGYGKVRMPHKLDAECYCSTPASQVSTAPPTPFQGWALPDTHEELMQGSRLFARLHSAGSSTLGENGDDEAAKQACLALSSEDEAVGEQGDVSTADSEDYLGGVCEEVLVDDREQVTCAGTPPLQSELGKWAQKVVAAEEWLEARLSTKFLVDNANLKALTVGMAFRLSRSAGHRDRSEEGPHWGSTVTGLDQGDGWVKVGRRYLPKTLGGQPVLIPASALGDHLVRVARGWPQKACSIDAQGVVHGAPAAWISRCFPGQPANSAPRLRRVRAKLARRRRERAAGRGEDVVLCADAGGKVSIYLSSTVDRVERRCCKAARAACRAAREKEDAPGYVFSTDASGVVQEWLAPGESL